MKRQDTNVQIDIILAPDTEPAHSFVTNLLGLDKNVDELLEEIFFVCNVAHEPGFNAGQLQQRLASDYRAAGCRSLSVGDTVRLVSHELNETRTFKVASAGFKEVTDEDNSMSCRGCGKHPSEIWEYTPDSTGEDLPAHEYVQREEGTFNRETGRFWCTACYVAVGMPLGTA